MPSWSSSRRGELVACLLACLAGAAAVAAEASKTAATGSLTASPNPIKVCDGSGLGTTTLSWTSKGTTAVEVHVGKPDGKLFAQSGARGSEATGNWVTGGMVFYLQDVSDKRPLTPENTLGTVTARLTTEGCR